MFAKNTSKADKVDIYDKICYNIAVRRDVLGCAIIFAYCLAVALLSLNPQFTFAKQSTQAKAVKSASTVVFQTYPDTPDPNQVFMLVNKERVARSSGELVADEKLAAVAVARAADMAKRQYYAHKNPDGKYYYDYFGPHDISVDYSCENLDMVFVPDVTMFISEWLASTRGHRECMVNNNLTSAGYAVTKMMLLDHNGKETPAYLVVAIHSTDLR